MKMDPETVIHAAHSDLLQDLPALHSVSKIELGRGGRRQDTVCLCQVLSSSLNHSTQTFLLAAGLVTCRIVA